MKSPNLRNPLIPPASRIHFYGFLYLLGLLLIFLSVMTGPTVLTALDARPEGIFRVVESGLGLFSSELVRTLTLLCGYGGLCVTYVWGLRKIDFAAVPMRSLLTWSVVLALLFLLLPPYFSDDIIGYAQHGRVLVHYGENPYLRTLSEFGDSWAKHRTYWASQPSPYGPVMTLLLAGVSWLGGDSLWFTVVLLKLLMAACYFVSAWMVYRICKRIAPERAFLGLFFFLWNPLVLLELVGQGHNDAFMMLLMMISFDQFTRERYAGSLIWMTISALSKVTTAVLIPVLAVFLLKRRLFRPFLIGSLASVFLVLVLVLPFMHSPDSLRGFREVSQLSWLSLSWLGREALTLAGLTEIAAHRSMRLLLAGTFLAILAWRLARTKITDSVLFAESALILLSFLLLANTQMNAWYLTLVVPVAAVFSRPASRAIVITLTFWPLLLYFRPWMYQPTLEVNIVRTVALYFAVGTFWYWNSRKSNG